MTCDGESRRYLGVLYHDIEFVDGASLPADFFDVQATRQALISEDMSSAAAQVGSVFWLGAQPAQWGLEDIEHDADSAMVRYSRGSGDDSDEIELETRTTFPGDTGFVCDSPEPIPGDAYHGSLCKRDAGYSIVWNTREFAAILDVASYPDARVTRDDILALAPKVEMWEAKATSPLLTNDAVRNFVADSLALVCPSQSAAIYAAAPAASFRFDPKTQEWTGTFGAFGEFAVADSKPVTIPTNHRDEVEAALSNNGVEFADCVAGEQPSPQAGDDQFGVTFDGSDGANLTFTVTGVDSQTESALDLCLSVANGACSITDPAGAEVRTGAINTTAVRPNVEKVQIALKPDELNRAGQWALHLDLGDGRTADATFELQ